MSSISRLCVAMFGCTAAALSAAPPASDIILANAEDLAPLPASSWVIASSMAGGPRPSGALAAIDRRDGSVRLIYPEPAAAAVAEKLAAQGRAEGDCPAAPPAPFKPHGIAYVPKGAAGGRLYVVNHGGRESIEFFDLTLKPVPMLRWAGCAVFPAGAFGNGVAAMPDGTLYATNMGRPLSGGAPVSEMGGDVLSWHAARGWRSVPDSAIVAPNGIVATPDGKQLYVASWSAGAVVAISTDGETARRTLQLDLLPDNLRWSDRGTIFAVGHRTSVAAVRDCYVSSATRCTIPSALAEIDPAKLTVHCTQPVGLDMATVAVPIGRKLWIGTARGDRISWEGRCLKKDRENSRAGQKEVVKANGP